MQKKILGGSFKYAKFRNKKTSSENILDTKINNSNTLQYNTDNQIM